MKRVVPFLFILLLMLPVSAGAQSELHWLSPTIGGNDAVMIVDNGDDWRTRLNLRSEQRKGSEIRGRIYTGTRVELYQDNGEWCTVGLNFAGGHVLTGEVMKQYLTPVGDDFSALCPLAVAKTETEVVTSLEEEIAHLYPGDKVYVMAVCGERYFMLIPNTGQVNPSDDTFEDAPHVRTAQYLQGYAPVSAFEELTEPKEGERIVYRTFYVPEGGLSFADEWFGDEFYLAGGVQLKDCWQIPGETDWHITFGAGIQRTTRVQGTFPEESLSEHAVPFEGEVYAYGKSFIASMGTINGQQILRRRDQNGDVFWALGDVPQDAVLLDKDPCEIKGEGEELLSRAVMDNIIAYVGRNYVLDERTHSERVSADVLERCTVHASLVPEPGTGALLRIHAWLEDADGSYVTGGDLNPKTGEIIRWGCNA